MLLAIILGACGAPAAPAPAAPAPPSAAAEAAPAAPATPPLPMDFGDIDDDLWGEIWDEMTAEERNLFGMNIVTHEESGRLMVYNVNVQLQTSEFEKGWRLILDSVDRLDGRYPHVIQWGDDMRLHPSHSRRAFFNIRIPTQNLAEFILIMENNYNIWRFEMTAQDESMTHRRTDYALQGLRDEEAMLAGMLEDADENENIADLQGQLNQLRGAIAGMEISQDQLMDDVIYSTITIELFEAFPPFAEEIVELTFGDQMSSALSDTTNRLVKLVQGLAIFAVLVLLPMLVIAAIVLVCIRVVNKTRRSKKLAKFLSGEELIEHKENDSGLE